jgi:hypothetical protein
MGMIVGLLIGFYVFLWLVSTLIIIMGLIDGYEDSFTKTDIKLSLLIPFYPILKEAYKNYSKLNK